MIIDFHTHFFPDRIAEKTVSLLSAKASIPFYSNGTSTMLLEKMQEAGVSIAINLPVLTNPASFESLNGYASGINESFNGKGIISFAGIHPDCDDIEGKMAWIKSAGFLGVKLHPDYQATYFDDGKYIEILECAKEHDLIVLTHAGYDVGFPDSPIHCTHDRARRVIEKVGHKKLVLAHLGGVKAMGNVMNTLCGLDVYLDTAFVLRYVGKENFLKILEKHGEDKILFGSDTPWSDIAADVNILRSFGLGEKTEEKIFCENAKKLLGIQ